jgi:hypothetical protein
VTFCAETFNAELTASESKLAVFYLEVVPMVHWLWVLIGFFLGVFIGIFIIAIISGRRDE